MIRPDANYASPALNSDSDHHLIIRVRTDSTTLSVHVQF